MFYIDESTMINLHKCRSVSSVSPLTCGVPQSSILAPILFSLYMLLLGPIFRKHGVSFHFYADDTQIYIPLKHNKKKGLEILFTCVAVLKVFKFFAFK